MNLERQLALAVFGLLFLYVVFASLRIFSYFGTFSRAIDLGFIVLIVVLAGIYVQFVVGHSSIRVCGEREPIIVNGVKVRFISGLSRKYGVLGVTVHFLENEIFIDSCLAEDEELMNHVIEHELKHLAYFKKMYRARNFLAVIKYSLLNKLIDYIDLIKYNVLNKDNYKEKVKTLYQSH